MTNLINAFFDFKGHENPHGYQSDTLLMQMALHPGDSLVYDEDQRQLTAQYPLSVATLKKRIDFVEKGTADFFKENDIAEPDIQPLSNGGESLVFNCNNGYVLKMRAGETYENKRWRNTLKAEKIGYSEELNMTYGIYPIAEPIKATPLQRMGMCAKAVFSGYIVTDPNAYNFGFVHNPKEIDKKTLMVIDEGAVKPIQTLHDIYALAKGLAKPLYDAIPVVHEPYRMFKKTIKDMLGWQADKKAHLPPLGVNAKKNF